MPTLEDQLRRYGDVLDDVAVRAGQPVELATAARPRRAARTAIVGAAVVAVVSLIAVVSSTRSTHEPSPATAPIVAATTTTRTEAEKAAAQAEAERKAAIAKAEAEAAYARSEAWIREHHGQVVDLHYVYDIAMSDRAFYVVSSPDLGATAPSVSRVDRRTLRIVARPMTTATGASIQVSGTAVYLLAHLRSGSEQLQRLDPETLRPVWTIPLIDGGGPLGPTVAGGPDTVWVSLGHRLQQLDGQSGRVIRSLASSATDSNVGASIALDPTGATLYVAYGDGGGGQEAIETRDAHTGTRLQFNAAGASALGGPLVFPTGAGAWIAFRGGMNGGASFYRASDVKRSAELILNGTSGFSGGVTLAPAGDTLWVGNDEFVACADARTGRGLNEVKRDASNINIFSIAADSTSVAVTVNGTLGIFKPHDLCPPRSRPMRRVAQSRRRVGDCGTQSCRDAARLR